MPIRNEQFSDQIDFLMTPEMGEAFTTVAICGRVPTPTTTAAPMMLRLILALSFWSGGPVNLALCAEDESWLEIWQKAINDIPSNCINVRIIRATLERSSQ